MQDISQSRYFNRELSWLDFNQRVLEEAQDTSLPLLERLKFLAITASNLDEFMSVRLGGLLARVAQHAPPDVDGMLPEQLMPRVLEKSRQLVTAQYTCWRDDLQPALNAAGLRRLAPGELNEKQSRVVDAIFDDELYSILTPMAVDEEHTFPILPGLSLNLLIRVIPPASVSEWSGDRSSCPADDQSRWAVLPLGKQRSRFILLPVEQGLGYLLLEDVIQAHLSMFFRGATIEEVAVFRLTRNADLELREESAANVLSEMQEILEARRESPCVRIELQSGASSAVREFLIRQLQVREDCVFEIPGPLDLSAFSRLTEIQGFDHLKYEPWPPVSSPDVDPSKSMFVNLGQRDVLLYHPYESFDPVIRFVEEAAEDPDVLAIKQTLYRTSARSPIVQALRRAAEKGKYVTAVIELKARFDEARNIEWARDLERSGVQVIYGVRGLKTHAKICLIVRREPHGLVRYVHLGTGNYNEQTARVYSDVSFMTSDDDLGADATTFFHALTGYSQPQRLRKLEMAPLGLRERLLEMIDVEIQNRRMGKKGLILLKLNALVDPVMIEALYRASQAGVKIRLNVRGICCLRPGVPELSENIRVTSIIDRFLEHSRILYFYHGGDSRLFVSSADWMPRNLDRRVELLIPIEQPALREKLLSILKIHLQDNVKSRELQPDGQYIRVQPESGEMIVRSQEALYKRAVEAWQSAREQPLSAFEPYRPRDYTDL